VSRLAAALIGALLLVGLTAAPAFAHTRASTATNFDSRITEAPQVPGVTWRLYPGGEYLEVTNTGSAALTVLGYDGEPYLRIGPDGVERNRNSPATYRNRERYGDVAIPPRADPDAAPDWEHLSQRPRYAWFDHRAHWMPGQTVSGVETWTVPFTHDDRTLTVTGTLRWEPGPPWWPWVLAALVLTAPALTGRRAAAAVVAVVALVNLAHLPDELAALPVPTLDVVFGVLHNVLFIGAGLAGAGLAWRGRTTSLLPLGIGAGAVLFHQGLLQLSQLGASQLATIWPPAVIRMLVALSLAQAVWVAAVIVAGLRRAPQPATEPGSGTFVPAEPVLSASDNP
jgi:hypothetical protein